MKLGLASAVAGGTGGGVNYRLVRQRVLDALRCGALQRHEVCDAQRELRRNAAFCGEATGELCPVCEEYELVHVTYVFGPRLPSHGRCVTTTAELARLRARKGSFVAYVVEVCSDCAWNHLVRSGPLSGR